MDIQKIYWIWIRGQKSISAHLWSIRHRWADCENVPSESNPNLQKLHPVQTWSTKILKIISSIQSWSAHVK